MSASIPSVAIEYDMPDAQAGGVCSTQYAWAKVPRELSTGERLALKEKIKGLLREKNAVMVSHYYVHPDLQDLAEETGGIVSDSLEMARFGRDHAAQTLVVSGCVLWGRRPKFSRPKKPSSCPIWMPLAP